MNATFDVAVIGAGPGGSSCAAFCAASGLHVLLLEREKFPREKVCGDCLNPECWPILRRLGLEEKVRACDHAAIDYVEFISRHDQRIRVNLPNDEHSEISVRRSLLDALLLERARALGADVREETTLMEIERVGDTWQLTAADTMKFRARVLVAADGRNSTVARLLGLLPRVTKERIGLQAHVPIPPDFGKRIVLQWLPGGYSGQAPVNDRELNVCLVGEAKSITALKTWAVKRFTLAPTQMWRTITPLRRAALPPAREGLLLVGDVARVVEPFTGEGIYYAMRSGEMAAGAAEKMIRGDAPAAATNYAKQHAALYRGRLWINSLARAAVVSPALSSAIFQLARFQPGALRFLTSKIVTPSDRL